MRISRHVRGPAPPERWQQELSEHLDKHLLPLLTAQRADDALIKATVEQVRARWVVSLQLHLPGRKIVAASVVDPDVLVATDKVVTRLVREARHHFERLGKQYAFRRKARRERLRELKARVGALPQAVAQEATASIEALVKRLDEVARRELAFLRAAGDLPADYPQVDDVVDEAIAATKAAWEPGRSPEAVWRELLRHLFAAIDREVQASRQFGEAVPLEAPMPPAPADVAESMVQEEIYEFYQPDDHVTIADVLSDTEAAIPGEAEEAAPETALAEQAVVADVLRTLPIAWRRALLLAEQEGMPAEDIAAALASTAEEVRRWIEQARAFVSARLGDIGIWDAARGLPGIERWLERRS